MNLKEQAAREALKFVKNGMVIGLGTGSTTKYFTELLGAKLKDGALEGIIAVPTSESTAALARTLGIPLGSLDDHEVLDIAVDGADEVDPEFNLIKGLGKALLREKIVEIHAKHFVVVVDESKMVKRLGLKGPLPVEIIPFQVHSHVRWLNTLGCEASLWFEENGDLAVTDNGNNLALCTFEKGIPDPHKLAFALDSRPGIVEHGLFLGMAGTVVVAGESGVLVRNGE